MQKIYAVITTYNFDNEVPIKLFRAKAAAKAYLAATFEAERTEDVANGWTTFSELEEDGERATIVNVFGDHSNITTFYIEKLDVE